MIFNDVKFICFDLGGTLIINSEKHPGLTSNILSYFKGLDKSFVLSKINETLRTKNGDFEELWKHFLNQIGATFVPITTVSPKAIPVLDTCALNILSELSKSYKIGVISNVSEYEYVPLKDLGIKKFINFELYSFKEGLLKPEVTLFNKILELAKANTNQSIFIGDDFDKDIQPAQSLGWKTIYLKKNQITQANNYQNTLVINGLCEIKKILLTNK